MPGPVDSGEFLVLRAYASDRQCEFLDAIQEAGSFIAAARLLGVNESVVRKSMHRLRREAARRGYSPDHDMTHPVPDGYKVKGVSTLYDQSSGQARMQWVKSDLDRERQLELMREAIEGLCSEITPAEPVSPPADADRRLCNLFVVTDYHMGMLAWRKEGGADWDLKIAERTLIGCFRKLVDGAPKAKTAIVTQLGDFLHTDGLIPATPTSGHILDADGRFEKIVDVAVRALRAVVDMALETHESVVVVLAEGNHDIASSVWLRCMFGALYENEPRVHIDRSALPYYAHRHGSVMLAFHHGHLKKMDRLAGVFAAQFAEMWGQTKFRYGHVGHEHHKHVLAEREDAGMTVEMHRTLAARDAHSSRHGYFAERKIKCITYHEDHGEVAANYVTPEMMDAA